MLVFVDGVHIKNGVEVPPNEIIGIDKVVNALIIIGVSIDNEMTTPKSFHDVTTPTENLL